VILHNNNNLLFWRFVAHQENILFGYSTLSGYKTR
jgi:hypothetical protein